MRMIESGRPEALRVGLSWGVRFEGAPGFRRIPSLSGKNPAPCICVHSPKWAGSLLGARLGIRGMLGRGRTACCGVGACSPCIRGRRVVSGQVIVSGWRMASKFSSLSRKDNDLNCGQIASARNAQNFAHSTLLLPAIYHQTLRQTR